MALIPQPVATTKEAPYTKSETEWAQQQGYTKDDNGGRFWIIRLWSQWPLNGKLLRRCMTLPTSEEKL